MFSKLKSRNIGRRNPCRPGASYDLHSFGHTIGMFDLFHRCQDCYGLLKPEHRLFGYHPMITCPFWKGWNIGGFGNAGF